MDINKIEELIKVLESSQIEELSVRRGESTVMIRKGRRTLSGVRPAGSAAPGEPAVAQAAQEIANERFILAPMVGIFHSVDGVPSMGAAVGVGQVVGTIESMKLLNDVVCDVAGKVTEVLVEDGMPVEYGQPLCRIEPAG